MNYEPAGTETLRNFIAVKLVWDSECDFTVGHANSS